MRNLKIGLNKKTHLSRSVDLYRLKILHWIRVVKSKFRGFNFELIQLFDQSKFDTCIN